MAEKLVQQTESNASGTTTVTVDKTDSRPQGPVCILKLKKPKSDQKVQWTTDTVDNEEMDKKKSKCCCIYHKPRIFGESSSESSSDSDEMCSGHAEKKKKKKKPACDFHDHGGKPLGQTDDGATKGSPPVDAAGAVEPARPEPEEPDAP